MRTEEGAARASVPEEGGPDADAPLLLGLRRRDEQAFATLVDRYHARLVRLAGLVVADQAVAEDVAQETWIGVLQGIDRFAGRSSFRPWLFRILTNQGQRRGQREARSLLSEPLSTFVGDAALPLPAPDC